MQESIRLYFFRRLKHEIFFFMLVVAKWCMLNLPNFSKDNYLNLKSAPCAVQKGPTKGQLISKCPFGVIVRTKIPTKNFPRFLPQPLKRGQMKEIKELYYTNQGLFNIFGIIKFLIQPFFIGQGRNLGNNFVGISVQTMTPKGHFEIN